MVRTSVLTAMLNACAAPLPLVGTAASGQIDVELADEAVLTGVVDDLPLAIHLYDERTDWYLPAYLDNDPWGAVLWIDTLARAEGGPSVLDVQVDRLDWSHEEPLVVEWFVESAAGRVSGPQPPTNPIRPSACSITVEADTTPEAHSADIATCLADWADLNGAPIGLHLRVEAHTEVPDYTFVADVRLSTHAAVEAGCTGPMVLEADVTQVPSNMELRGVELWGWATAGASPAWVAVWENTFDGADWAPSAGGLASVQIPANTTVALVPETFPGDWGSRSLATLAAVDGFVDSCAVVVHEADPTYTSLRLAATVRYAAL